MLFLMLDDVGEGYEDWNGGRCVWNGRLCLGIIRYLEVEEVGIGEGGKLYDRMGYGRFLLSIRTWFMMDGFVLRCSNRSKYNHY